ncbi:40256_t:CDS:2 [Gigaspora margarita]|uniref:40256_t:CDS:1 n=1 Tax=Gigaspora margarita TaxID=4874 RepID=A0ABN7UCZ1_GIGMA|nr:40256_t:CDS:2 [Gigaspora margarita]
MSTDKNSKSNELRLSNDELYHFDDELTYSDDSNYKNLDNNKWFPTGEMCCLLTKIHKNSLLPKTTRTEILKNQPRNSEIKYKAPTLEYIEIALKDKRSLLLDSLSYTNELRKLQSFKVISPNYVPPSEREEVFGEELGSNIEKENTTNKLFDKAADSRAITGHITEHKIREMGFRAATIMEVAQDYTTQVLQQINKRLYTCGKKVIISPVRIDTINRLVMAYEHYQKWLPL